MHVRDLRLVELVLRQRVLDGEFAAHVDGHHVGESTSPDGNDRRSAGHSGNGAGGVDLGDGRVARLERDCTIAVAALQVGDDGVRPADVHIGLMLGEVETGQQHAGRDLGVGEHALVDLHLVDQASEAGAADHVDRCDDIVHLRPRVRRADLRAVDVHGQSGCLVLSPRDVIPRARLEVVPEDAAIVQDAFNYFENTVSQRATVRYVRETYGVNWCDATFRRMLKEKLYTGVYDRGGRYNDQFCPAIINRQQFDRVQALLTRNVRSAPSGKVYIFTSILTCAECGHKLVGYKSSDYYYYRCNQHFQRGRCSHNHSAREDVVEAWLFDHLGEELERCQLEWDVEAAKKKASVARTDKAALKRKLTKLKELYVNDLIDIEDYKKDYQIYVSALNQIPEPAQEAPPDFAAVRRLLDNSFRTIYDTLTREEKRTLWRSVIKEIRIDNDQNITGVVFG